MGGSGRIARLLRSSAQSEADELQAQLVLEHQVCQSICDCQVGQMVSLAGTVRSVTIVPKERAPSFEIELYDGSGSAAIIWLGRRSIPGIAAGRRLVITGRITNIAGRYTIYNPRYQLKPMHA